MDFTQAAVDILICVVQYGVGLMRWMLIECIKELAVLLWLITIPFDAFLPDALDQDLPEINAQWLGWINWIFPLGLLSQLYTYVLGAFAVYRVLRWIANRMKVPVQPKLF